jgi:hypothetical protein
VHPPTELAEPVSAIISPENGASKAPLERDGQQFRRCLEQLCDCANGLRNTAKFYKETQQLERLAKHLKALAKA